MIKRISKLATLIMVAGTTISIIPTVSANAAVALQTLDGTMSSVQAFDNGRYLYDGYKDATDDTEIYFFDGHKDIELKDLDGDYKKYGKNYATFLNDNSIVDLTTGEVLNETTDYKKEFLETKLKSKVVKKAERYSNTQNLEYVGQLDNKTFDNEWFEYKVTNENSTETYTLFVDESGKYIDSTENLNIIHYLKDGTKIEIKTYEDSNSNGYDVVFGKAIFSDKDYIYRAVKLTNKTDSSDTETYIQKISKESGNIKDGAYLPKDVKSYSLSDLGSFDVNSEKFNGMDILAKGESLYTINFVDSKITMKKYDFVKERDFSDTAVTNDRLYKLVEDTEYKGINNEKIDAYDIDKDNTLWILNKGKISRVNGNKLDEMYTVERNMKQISVYDENDIVVWNGEEGIYSTVGGTTLKLGWTKYPDGTWSYLKEDGSKTTGWVNDSGTWYYLDDKGIMQTGWLKEKGTWYYLNENGSMKTGFFKEGKNNYYLDNTGAMKNNGWNMIDSTWYYFNENGSAKTGWYLENNLWYYFNEAGQMLTNTVVDGYKIGNKGFWVK